MREKPSAASTPEFKGVSLDTYAASTVVTAKIGGKWETLQLTDTPVIENKKLKLKIWDTVTSTDREILVDDPPRVVAFPPSAGREVFSYEGRQFEVTNFGATGRGDVEYKLEERGVPAGRAAESVENVPQEILVAWKKLSELNKKAEALSTQISTVVIPDKRVELAKVHAEVQKKIDAAFAAIPDMDAMDKQNRRTLDALKEKTERLHAEADGQIKDLEKNVTAATGTKIAKSFTSFERASAGDKEASLPSEKEAHERRAKAAKQLETDFNQELGVSGKKALDAALKQKRDLAQAAFDAEKAKATPESTDGDSAEEGGKKGGKKKGEGKGGGKGEERFDSGKITLTPQEQVAATLTERKKIVEEMLISLEMSDLGKEVLAELDRRRKELAQTETLGHKKNHAGDDYSDEFLLEKNTLLLPEILKEWQVPFEEAGAAPEKEGEFDYDKERAEVIGRADALLAEMSEAGAVKKGYEALAATVDGWKKSFEKAHKDTWGTQAKAVKSGVVAAPGSMVELNRARGVWLDLKDSEMNGFEEQYRQAELRSIKKDVDNNRKEVEKATPESAPVKLIDIPHALIEKMLEDRIGEVKAVMRAIYKKEPGAKDGLKSLFHEYVPDQGLLKQLREYGVKDWEGFQKVWEERVAGEVADTMARYAEMTLRGKVSESINGIDITKALWPQIVARALTTTVLVGGASLAVGALVASGGATVAVAGAVASGAAGGALRGFLNKKVFEKWGWMKQKTEQQLETMRTEKTDRLIDQMLDEQFGVGDGDPAVATQGSLTMFSAVLSETIRDATATAEELYGEHPDEAKTLKGNDRHLYEQALERLDARTVDQEQRKELALMITRMNDIGGKMALAAEADSDPAVVSALNSVLSAHSGKYGVSVSAISGAAMAGAFFVDQAAARAAFGAIGGAVAGVRFAEGMWEEGERNDARERIKARINLLRNYNAQAMVRTPFTADEKASARELLIWLKQIMHGTAGPEDMKGLVYKVKGAVAGEDDVRFDRLFLSQIQAEVYEGDRNGLLFEEEPNATSLERALEAMKLSTDQVAHAQEKKFATKLKKFGARALGFVGGALAGATTAVLVGERIQELKDKYIGGGTSNVAHTERVNAQLPPAPETANSSPEVTSDAVSSETGAVSREMPQRTPEIDGRPYDEIQYQMDAVVSPEVTSDIQWVGDGKGLTYAVDADIKAHPERILAFAKAHPSEWSDDITNIIDRRGGNLDKLTARDFSKIDELIGKQKGWINANGNTVMGVSKADQVGTRWDESSSDFVVVSKDANSVIHDPTMSDTPGEGDLYRENTPSQETQNRGLQPRAESGDSLPVAEAVGGNAISEILGPNGELRITDATAPSDITAGRSIRLLREDAVYAGQSQDRYVAYTMNTGGGSARIMLDLNDRKLYDENTGAVIGALDRKGAFQTASSLNNQDRIPKDGLSNLKPDSTAEFLPGGVSLQDTKEPLRSGILYFRNDGGGVELTGVAMKSLKPEQIKTALFVSDKLPENIDALLSTGKKNPTAMRLEHLASHDSAYQELVKAGKTEEAKAVAEIVRKDFHALEKDSKITFLPEEVMDEKLLKRYGFKPTVETVDVSMANREWSGVETTIDDQYTGADAREISNLAQLVKWRDELYGDPKKAERVFAEVLRTGGVKNAQSVLESNQRVRSELYRFRDLVLNAREDFLDAVKQGKPPATVREIIARSMEGYDAVAYFEDGLDPRTEKISEVYGFEDFRRSEIKHLVNPKNQNMWQSMIEDLAREQRKDNLKNLAAGNVRDNS